MRATNDPKVYYVTESGMKRHIPNIEVFNSYGNKWEDVIVLPLTNVSSYPDNILIKLESDPKVYKLENGQKRWIQTAEAFNRLKFNWSKIAPVNSVELNFYPTGSIIN